MPMECVCIIGFNDYGLNSVIQGSYAYGVCLCYIVHMIMEPVIQGLFDNGVCLICVTGLITRVHMTMT